MSPRHEAGHPKLAKGGTNPTTFTGEVPGSGFLTTVEPTP